MNEPQPNILLEITRGLITCAGWWVLFYKLHRPTTKARRIAMLVSLPAGYVLWRYCVYNDITLTEFYPPLFYALLWAAIILIFALITGGGRSVFFTAIYYIGTEQFIDVTRICAFGWILGGWLEPGSLERYIQFNVHYLVVLGWTVWYYRIMRRHKTVLPFRVWLVYLMPPIAVFLLITFFDMIAEPLLLEQGINIYVIGFMTCLIFFAFHHYSFYLYLKQMKLFDLEIQTQSLQSQLESQTRQNRIIEGAQKQSGEIRHEMKNLLFALQIELRNKNYEGIEKRIDTLLGEMKQYELKPYTAVPVIDAMIAYKGEKLREAGTVFLVSADPLYVSDKLAYDIASLLAIALDNVTDAVILEKNAKDVPVHCTISRRKNLVFITISNPLTRPLKYSGGELQSTKEEPGHGLGLQALRRIVERYTGDVTISDKEGTFLLKIMLMGD